MCTYELGGWDISDPRRRIAPGCTPKQPRAIGFSYFFVGWHASCFCSEVCQKDWTWKGSTSLVLSLEFIFSFMHTVSWWLWLGIIWCPLMSNVKICLVRQHWPRDQDFSPLSWPNLVVEGGVGGEHAGTTDCLKHHKRIVKPDPKT